jgi:hypothetical protein
MSNFKDTMSIINDMAANMYVAIGANYGRTASENTLVMSIDALTGEGVAAINSGRVYVRHDRTVQGIVEYPDYTSMHNMTDGLRIDMEPVGRQSEGWFEMMHYMERINERTPDLAPIIERRIVKAATSLPTGNHAVYIYRLPEFRGSTDANYYARTVSNGNLVVAIIRDGIVSTVMLRRENQPMTADAMRVNFVHHFAGVWNE